MKETSLENIELIHHYNGEMVLLDKANQQLLEAHKPTWKSRLFTRWAYSERVWAEELTRRIREAETIMLTEETLLTITGITKRADYCKDWETILASMHKDVH